MFLFQDRKQEAGSRYLSKLKRTSIKAQSHLIWSESFEDTSKSCFWKYHQRWRYHRASNCLHCLHCLHYYLKLWSKRAIMPTHIIWPNSFMGSMENKCWMGWIDEWMGSYPLDDYDYCSTCSAKMFLNSLKHQTFRR